MALLALVMLCFSAEAEEGDAAFDEIAPVNMAWATLRPMVFPRAQGQPEGAMIELARALADEIGFELNTFQVSSFPEWGQAQSGGTSTMLPLVAKLPNLAPTNVFSDLATVTSVRLAVNIADVSTFDTSDLTGRKIGVTSPGIGSDPALLPGAILVNYPNIQTAIIGLLAREVDAISSEALFTLEEERAAQLDHRISFVGPPLMTVERFVAIHESRAELLAPVNAALAKMKADGRLDAILQHNNVIIPPAAPDVLTVGVAFFPPDNIYNDDGTFSGFAVERLRDLAERAGLKLKFKAITKAEFDEGPSPKTYDMLSHVGISDARRKYMDFTRPIQRLELAIFTRKGEAGGLSDLDSLGSRKVGVESINLASRIAERHGGLNLHSFEGMEALLRGLADGKVDAVLDPSVEMRAEIKALGLTDKIEEASTPFRVIEHAPALRFGLGDVRERLNSVIPVYLISDEYAALRQKYFGKPVIWTKTRIYAVLGAGSALLLGLMGLAWWQRQRQRRMHQQMVFDHQRRNLEREQAHTERLTQFVNELERSNRELDDFAYTASHDLKEPLRGIAINAEFLSREALSEKGQSRVERMVMLATRMDRLVSDLLFLSRLGRGEKVMKDVDVAHIIEGIEKEITEWVNERSGKIVPEDPLPWVHAERTKVKTLFQNLIVNGLKYNNSATKIIEIGFDAEVEVNGKSLCNVFWVRDNGIGIAEQNHEKVFRIFQRLNREEDYGAGTGAGLSFVRKIIEEHDGTISLTSKLGKGTTFYFKLPLADLGGPRLNEEEGSS